MREHPQPQQDFPHANGDGNRSGEVFTQDPRHDRPVARDSIEQLTVEPVENPHGADQGPQGDLQLKLADRSDSAAVLQEFTFFTKQAFRPIARPSILQEIS